MPNLIDLTGKVYGRLTVISLQHRPNGATEWFCKCSCGKNHQARGNQLKRGIIKSCGCFQREDASIKRRIHGDNIGNKKTKEYLAWICMKSRCKNNHPDYGGRGIKVCDRWIRSYSHFLLDMGRAPSPKHSIDRIENNGNYEPGNCRWATRAEQAINKRNTILITYRGVKKPLLIWCKEFGYPYQRALRLVKKGWSVEMIFEQLK